MGGYRNYYFTVLLTAEKGRIKRGERVQREGGTKDANRAWGTEGDGTGTDGDMWMHVSRQQMRLYVSLRNGGKNKPARWRRHTAKSCFYIYKHS